MLYGAAGVAHHAGATRVLLERGADPNDGEVVYHTPETYDNAVMGLLVASGKLTPDGLATLLLRKHDWHDGDGVKLLLEHGADPNLMTRWGHTALHQALRRDNDLKIIELLLDHGANPSRPAHGRSATALAAREGRGDVLDLFARRGIPIVLEGLDRLLAACARHDARQVQSLAAGEAQLVQLIRQHAGRLLGEFAGVGNTEGVRHLLEPRMRRLVLDRSAIARIGCRAARGRRVGPGCHVSVRLRRSRRAATAAERVMRDTAALTLRMLAGSPSPPWRPLLWRCWSSVPARCGFLARSAVCQ